MTITAELADFALAVEYEDFATEVQEELKKRVLDSIGVAIGALGADATTQVYRTVTELNGDGNCRLWGTTHSVSLEGAAMYNTVLTRYLDFMDSFLTPGETTHPSDNIASIIAVAEDHRLSGAELLGSIGVAYEIQGELAWNAPVRDRGWDHVTHTVISAAVGAGKARGLGRVKLQHAIGIAGTAHNALRVTQTSEINEWKGIASANAARNAVYSVVLADHGIEGPVNLFEGQKGWKQIIAGDFKVHLDPGCVRVLDTMTKRYVAETYAQSAIEGIIELAATHNIDHNRVKRIHLDTFHGAALIIGGGEGDRYGVRTKAQADHSLPYMLAAALIDRELTNAAYEPKRIQQNDVQKLLRTVVIKDDERHTEEFVHGRMPATIDVELADGTKYHIEKDSFQGHPTKPMSWEQIEEKFERMTSNRYDEQHRSDLIETIKTLDEHDVANLVALLD
jgi:2-methylcitrate dehydratase